MVLSGKFQVQSSMFQDMHDELRRAFVVASDFWLSNLNGFWTTDEYGG